MTDKQQALRDLLATIEADSFDRWSTANSPFTSPQKAFVRQAYNGALDAAKALHDSLLPEWSYVIDSVNAVNVVYPSVEGDAIYCEGVIDQNCGPARAWLIAIIKALIASEGGE